ncbi:Hypothetical predicted protein [Paramuricea clavata]|uniref:Uncharacterized protein n=1 Tax=Paramuricea clavata TaxID=317549 RepID=A0A6S7K6P8_PARCT|nr:Hypothetical predicted protein [Paramuricea clavata]
MANPVASQIGQSGSTIVTSSLSTPPVQPAYVQAIGHNTSSTVSGTNRAGAAFVFSVGRPAGCSSRQKEKEFVSVVEWLEAFGVYMLIVTAYHPQRITDLLRYLLLGLRTAQKFSSKVWLTYDVAFRKDAAAREPPVRFVSVVTPLCVSVFRRELEDHPDKGRVNYVCDGIQHGFRTGFCPELVHLRSSSRNMRSASDHPDVVDAYIGTELSKGRVIGPFTDPPVPNLHCSPFGVIPKKNQPGKWHLILDLSSPDSHSVNDGIPS